MTSFHKIRWESKGGVNVTIDHKITSYDPKSNPDINLHLSGSKNNLNILEPMKGIGKFTQFWYNERKQILLLRHFTFVMPDSHTLIPS